jgi:hypothetical protein
MAGPVPTTASIVEKHPVSIDVDLGPCFIGNWEASATPALVEIHRQSKSYFMRRAANFFAARKADPFREQDGTSINAI